MLRIISNLCVYSRNKEPVLRSPPIQDTVEGLHQAMIITSSSLSKYRNQKPGTSTNSSKNGEKESPILKGKKKVKRDNIKANETHDDLKYKPLKLQEISLNDPQDSAFITEAKTASSRNKRHSNIFVNETLKSASKIKAKSSQKPRNSRQLALENELEQIAKPLTSSLIVDTGKNKIDFSYRK